MFAIYHGQDDYSRTEAVRALRDGLGDAEMASLNTTIVSASEARPAEVIAQAGVVPFLASGRLVVIEGLLGLFEGRSAARGGGRRRAAAKGTDTADPFRGWGALKEVAAQLPETNTLVLSDGAIGAANPLFKHLSPVAEVRSFQPLRGGALTDWVRRRVAAQKGKIDAGAVRTLMESCGGNLWVLDAEIEKLVLYTGGVRAITSEDARTMVTDVREENIFALVDDVIERRYAQARKRLERLLETGVGTSQVIAMLGTQLRRLIAAKDLKARRASRKEMEDGVGTRSDFALRKAVSQSERFSMDLLVRMHRGLLNYDLAMKTGELTEGTALELLIADLCGVGTGWRRVTATSRP